MLYYTITLRPVIYYVHGLVGNYNQARITLCVCSRYAHGPLNVVENIVCLDIKVTASKAVLVQAWTGPEISRGFSRQSTDEGGKIVRPTQRPPLPPGDIPGT